MQEIGCSGFVKHQIDASYSVSSLIKYFLVKTGFFKFLFETHSADIS